MPSGQQQQQQHQHNQQQRNQQQQHTAAAQGFKSLGLQLHPGSSVVSYVYMKRQKMQEGADSSASMAAHALYVTGLPLGLDEASLQSIFQLFGEVEDVVMHPSKVCLLVCSLVVLPAHSARTPSTNPECPGCPPAACCCGC